MACVGAPWRRPQARGPVCHSCRFRRHAADCPSSLAGRLICDMESQAIQAEPNRARLRYSCLFYGHQWHRSLGAPGRARCGRESNVYYVPVLGGNGDFKNGLGTADYGGIGSSDGGCDGGWTTPATCDWGTRDGTERNSVGVNFLLIVSYGRKQGRKGIFSYGIGLFLRRNLALVAKRTGANLVNLLVGVLIFTEFYCH